MSAVPNALDTPDMARPVSAVPNALDTPDTALGASSMAVLNREPGNNPVTQRGNNGW